MRRLRELFAVVLLVLVVTGCTRSRDRALGQALVDGRWQEARDLVRDGASIDAPQSVRFGEPVLVRLATLPGPEGVKVALELGADPDRGDYMGRTALMFAAANDRVETMRLLIGAGADVNAWAAGGRSAMAAAKHAQANQAIAILREAGVRDEAARRLFP